MQTYQIEADSVRIGSICIPVIWRGRIAVIGGGAAGLTAAIAGARRKIPVLVIEKNSYFGGAAASGGGRPIEGAFPGKVSGGGVADELFAKIRFAGADLAELVSLGERGSVYYYDSEYFKKLAEEFLVKSGCERMLNTTVIQVLAAGDKVEAVIVSYKLKTGAILADTFIDATGSALAAQHLGVPVVRESEAGSYSFPYIVSHVNTDTFKQYRKTDSGFIQAAALAEQNGLVCPDREWLWNLQADIFPDRLYADTIRVSLNPKELLARQFKPQPFFPTDTEAVMEARRRMYEQIRFFREYVPGMEQCELYRCSDQVLCLNNERIQGADYLDIASRSGAKRLPDGIVRCRAFPEDTEPWYELPFGVMAVPQYGNLLVTGKGISADAAIREHMGTAARMVMGQCAGSAAALMALKKIKNTELGGALLRSLMDEIGCDTDGDKTAVFHGGRQVEEVTAIAAAVIAAADATGAEEAAVIAVADATGAEEAAVIAAADDASTKEAAVIAAAFVEEVQA